MTIRSLRHEIDGKLRYLTVACGWSRTTKSTAKYCWQPNPTTEIKCKAKINATPMSR